MDMCLFNPRYSIHCTIAKNTVNPIRVDEISDHRINMSNDIHVPAMKN